MTTSSATQVRPGPALARRAVAVFLILHGVAHLVGAQAALIAVRGDTSVAYLLGGWDVAGTVLYALTAAWIAAAAGYVVAAAWIWSLRSHWRAVLLAVTAESLVLSVLALPPAVAGVAIDVVLLAAVAFWRPRTTERGPRT